MDLAALANDALERVEGSDWRAASMAGVEQANKPKLRRMKFWTDQEEEALWSALKKHGPGWTLIEQLHGTNGKINESLKGRIAKALYKKASYTKHTYLEAGVELPDYLQDITANGVQMGKKRNGSGKTVDGHDNTTAHAAERRKQEPGSSIVKQEETAIVMSDSDEAENIKVENIKVEQHALPSITPETQQSASADTTTTVSAANTDPALIKLRLQAAAMAREEAKCAREEAELKVLLYQSEHPQ